MFKDFLEEADIISKASEFISGNSDAPSKAELTKELGIILNVFNQLIKAKRIQIVAKILNQYGSENKYGLILKKDGNSFRFADSEPSENFEEDLKAFLKNMIEDLKKDEDSACLFIVICSENKII